MEILWTVGFFTVTFVLAYAFFHKDTPKIAMFILFVVWMVVFAHYLHIFLFITLTRLDYIERLVGTVFFTLVPLILGNKYAPSDPEEGEAAEGGRG